MQMNKSSDVYGWGVVGTGRHADTFFVPALKQAQGTKLVAIYSRDKDRGAAFAAKHEAERSYDDFSKMLADPEIDIVYVASPNNLHASQTIQAAAAGKHVLCEKPMALTVEDCESMIKACQEKGLKLGLDFHMRHHPAHVEAHRLIQSGVAGEITLVTAQYSHGIFGGTLGGVTVARWRQDPEVAGGGAIMGMGIHCLDLLRFLLGKEVEEVRALTDEKWSGQPVDQETFILMKFKDGPFCFVTSSMRVRQAYNDMVIYGTKARITGMNTMGMPMKGELQVDSDTFTSKMEFPTQKTDSAGRTITVLDRITGNYVRRIEAFNKDIKEDREPNPSGKDGLQIVRLTNAILESSRQGRAVRLME